MAKLLPQVHDPVLESSVPIWPADVPLQLFSLTRVLIDFYAFAVVVLLW